MSEQVQHHVLDLFELQRKIGSGAYGHVWKAKDKSTNEIVALKKIFDAFQHSMDAQRTFREINYLKLFNHQNIIGMKKVIRSQNEKDVYVVFEYMQVDLHRVIREDILKQKHKRFIIYQIAKALRYLHSAQLIHRDLKPSNVLLNQQCHIKLCDFGLVRSVKQNQHQVEPIMTEYVATRWYRSPQLLFGWNKYSKSIDIWSFGCLIAEMFKNQPLFPGSSTLDQISKVIGWTGYPTTKEAQSIKGLGSDDLISAIKIPKNKPTRKQSWFVNLDPMLKDLISKMLEFHPSKRITIQQVLEHPYLQMFHDPNNQPTVKQPFLLQIEDSVKLSVKQYRQKIWKFCKPFQVQSPMYQSKKTEDLSYFSRLNIKRRSLKGVSRQNKSATISKTLYLEQRKPQNFKSTVVCGLVGVKQKRFSSLHRRMTQTSTNSRSKILSSDQQKLRYRNQSSSLSKQKSFNNSKKKILNCKQFQHKGRSMSTTKSRNVYNYGQYRKYLKVL